MADAASFVVSMIDKVSGPANDAARAVEQLNKRIAKTGRVGFKFTGSGDAPAVLKRMNREALGLWASTRIGQPVMRRVSGAVDGLTNSMVQYGKYAVAAIGAGGVAAAAYAIKGTVHMAQFAETTRMAFGLLTGSKDVGNQVFDRTIALSTQLGMNVEDTAHSMQKLLAMQMAPADAEKWLKLGADLRSVGVDAGALQRVMLDIAHVKATGKLSMRNVNMFANAGVSSQLLMEEIGKAMGTDEKGAMEAMHKGKVTSGIALPALERAIMRKTHEHAAGEAGAGFANNTLTGLIERLKNAPALFFLKMADKAQDAIGRLKPLVDSVYKAIDSIQGDTFVRFISTALDMVTRMVPLAMEFAQGFGDGFSSIVDAMSAIDPAATSMQTARDLGHAVADGFGIALKALEKILDLVRWLDAHPLTAKLLGGAVVANSVSGGGLIGGALGLGAKGLVNGGGIAARGIGTMLGIGGTAAATTAAGTTAAGATGTAVATGTGATGAAALVAGVGGAAGVAAIGAAAAGVGAAAAGYIWREEIAKWMLGTRDDQATTRGLGGDATATPTLTGLQRAAVAPNRTNNVRMESNITINGADKDGKELAREVHEGQRGMLEQFFQSQALEQGAM
jgi:hypothetical protein